MKDKKLQELEKSKKLKNTHFIPMIKIALKDTENWQKRMDGVTKYDKLLTQTNSLVVDIFELIPKQSFVCWRSDNDDSHEDEAACN